MIEFNLISNFFNSENNFRNNVADENMRQFIRASDKFMNSITQIDKYAGTNTIVERINFILRDTTEIMTNDLNPANFERIEQLKAQIEALRKDIVLVTLKSTSSRKMWNEVIKMFGYLGMFLIGAAIASSAVVAVSLASFVWPILLLAVGTALMVAGTKKIIEHASHSNQYHRFKHEKQLTELFDFTEILKDNLPQHQSQYYLENPHSEYCKSVGSYLC